MSAASKLSGRQGLLVHHWQSAAVRRHSGEAQKGRQAKKMVRTCDMPNVTLPFLRKNIGNLQKIHPLLMTLQTLADKGDGRSGRGRKARSDEDNDSNDGDMDDDAGRKKKARKTSAANKQRKDGSDKEDYDVRRQKERLETQTVPKRHSITNVSP